MPFRTGRALVEDRIRQAGRTAARATGVDARSIAALVGVQTLFGLHYLAAKVIVETIPPRPWALLRAGGAGLLLSGFVVVRGLSLPGGRRVTARFFVLALIGVAINQYLFV